MGLSRRLQADLWILLLSAIWGCTFVVVKGALEDVSPLLFMTLRFAIATPLVFILVPRGSLTGRSTLGGALIGGIVTGLLLFSGFGLQTVGLQYTTAARSAFITGLAVILTPLLCVALRRRRPSLASLAGAALAFGGLYLLTGSGTAGQGFGRGELLTLLCAVAFAGHLIAVDHFTRRFNKAVIAFLQIAAAGLFTIAAAALWESPRFDPTMRLVVAVLVTAVLGTALAFYILSTVQSWTTPTRAAIILAAEPVFAALTAWIVDGEIFTRAALLGATLILTGMIMAELSPRRQSAH